MSDHDVPPSSRTRVRALSLSILAAAALTAIAAGPVAGAQAAVSITSPAAGSSTNNTTPSIAGTVEPLAEVFEMCSVEVSLYAGASASGPPLQTLHAEGCSWLTPPAAALEPGTYTAVASVTRFPDTEPEVTEPNASVSFTIDTTPPAVAIGSPSPGATTRTGSIPVAGSSGIVAGDVQTVTVQVFAGGAADGAPFEAIEMPAPGGAWSGLIAGLATGAYTLRAEQSDSAGNVGFSQPVSLTVLPPSPPAASFTWFPSSPQVGEQVSLISSSTDTESPITAFAWALGSSSPSSAGNPTYTTSFATPGPHVVRLKVTDAAGRSGEAVKTIVVRHHRATLMQPFPIVRIAGRQTTKGARLTLLTVTAPVSSRVTVRINGGKGRASSESRVATLRKPNTSATVVMSFPHFDRAITAGSVLEVRVTKAGEIGKLMRFVPHAGRLPTRQDTCLSATGKPMGCPSA
jgi:hypothetical protein